ncbi:MAG: hypothetical protein ACJAWS_002007 [Oleiphilaceae bacterium]
MQTLIINRHTQLNICDGNMIFVWPLSDYLLISYVANKYKPHSPLCINNHK